MDTKSIDFALVVDVFLLLLIGIGPKIALVPFLELTGGMDEATKARVVRKMLTTASVVAVILVVLGELLTRLLHFSPGSLAVAGGIILFILAATMILGSGEDKKPVETGTTDPLRLAVFPLAIPYLLNPVGIVVLVTVSAESESAGRTGLVVGLLALVLALDIGVFRWANRVGKHLDQSRMIVTEKVFGFLLAAVAVQLVLSGLDAVGVIHLNEH